MEPEKDSFDNHTPNEKQVEVIEFIRSQYKTARAALVNVPNSREKSIAMTQLEDSLMWAVKAVILNEDYYTREHE